MPGAEQITSHRERGTAEVDGETRNAVAAYEADFHRRAVVHLQELGEDPRLREVDMTDWPVRPHHLGVKLQLHRLEALPYLGLRNLVRDAKRRQETVLRRNPIRHLL